MRRHALIALLVLAVFTVGARAAQAQILPACDQTVYLIQDPETVSEADGICDPSKEGRPGCLVKTQSEYLALFPTEALQKANPPTVTTNGACGFNDFIQLFINLANWGLGIMSLLALGFTVWGGQTLLTSAGNSEKVQAGKQTIWGGILGITIVLTAWILVGFVTSALTGTGFTVFKDTPFARTFYGAGTCGPKFKACNQSNLFLTCKDTKENGDSVSRAQKTLADLGCYKRDIDGCFGPNTKKAVQDFQRANQGCTISVNGQSYSMPDYRTSPNNTGPDGIIGDITWAFLTGASQGNQMVCLSSLPGVGTCTGNPAFPCSNDQECSDAGWGTCFLSPSAENVRGC